MIYDSVIAKYISYLGLLSFPRILQIFITATLLTDDRCKDALFFPISARFCAPLELNLGLKLLPLEKFQFLDSFPLSSSSL